MSIKLNKSIFYNHLSICIKYEWFKIFRKLQIYITESIKSNEVKLYSVFIDMIIYNLNTTIYKRKSFHQRRMAISKNKHSWNN